MINNIKFPINVKVTNQGFRNHGKPDTLSLLTRYIQKYVEDEIFSSDLKNDEASKNEFIAECKMACKLAVKILQEAKNHNGNLYFTNTSYYGKLQHKEAIRLYHILIGRATPEEISKSPYTFEYSSAAEDLDELCCHSNIIIPNRKLSFWGTNYTRHAEKFRQFIDTSLETDVNETYLANRQFELLINEDSNKGPFLAHILNLEAYKKESRKGFFIDYTKSDIFAKQQFELAAIENILNNNSSITFKQVKHFLFHRNKHVLKQIILNLIINGGSEYQKFLVKLVPDSNIFMAKKGFYNSEILTEKLDIWVSEAPEREKQNRLTAKSRILDAYNRNLAILDLDGLNLTTLPVGVINALINLHSLTLSNNQLSVLPDVVFNNLTSLQLLVLEHNPLTALPDGIFNGLNHLRWLKLSNNLLTTLNAGIFNGLTELRELELINNQIGTLPAEIFNGLTELSRLNLTGNQLITFPDGLFNNLTKLEWLYLSNNQLVSLPDNIFNDLINLETLYLSHNQLGILQDRLFDGLTKLRELRLSHNQLSVFPIEIFNGLIKLREVRLENNRFNREVVNQIRNSFRHRNVRIDISVYEPESMRPIRRNLTIMANLNKILNLAKANYQLKVDWNQLEQHCIFNEFLNKVNMMADAKQGSKVQATVYASLAQIIIAMDQNPELREACFSVAHESIETCGDRVAFGFMQMQIQAKLYKPNSSLSELFAQQKSLCALDIIFELAQNKVKNLRGVIDEIEVYLTYIKNLKDYLQVEINNILYEALSDVTQADIESAKLYLESVLTDDYVYGKLLDSDTIQKRYASEFEKLQNQPKFDTSPQDGESDGAYKERMKNMVIKFREEKINFLKAQLKAFASLAPLVEDN